MRFANKGLALIFHQCLPCPCFQIHVSKPVDPDELVAILGSLVGRTGTS